MPSKFLAKFESHWFQSSVTLLFRRVLCINWKTTKNSQDCNSKCQHVGLHVHLQNSQSRHWKIRDVHTTSQHCPTMSTSHNDKDRPKNRDGKGQDTVTETQKRCPSKPTDWTTGLSNVHVRRSTAKEQSLVKQWEGTKTSRDEQTGFQAVTCDSKSWIPQQNAVHSQAKNKSSLAKCLSRTACVMQKSRKSKFTGAVRQTSGSPLLRIATDLKMIWSTKNCWCPNRKQDPLPSPNWWACHVFWKT